PYPASPTSSSTSSTRPARTCARVRPYRMLPATDRCGNSAPSCGTIATRRRSGGTCTPEPATIREPTSTSPASSRSNPATHRSSVVLPQPEGPSTAVSEPSGTARSTPASAWTRPYALRTPRTIRWAMSAPFPPEHARTPDQPPRGQGRDEDEQGGVGCGGGVLRHAGVRPQPGGERRQPGRPHGQGAAPASGPPPPAPVGPAPPRRPHHPRPAAGTGRRTPAPAATPSGTADRAR